MTAPCLWTKSILAPAYLRAPRGRLHSIIGHPCVEMCVLVNLSAEGYGMLQMEPDYVLELDTTKHEAANEKEIGVKRIFSPMLTS